MKVPLKPILNYFGVKGSVTTIDLEVKFGYSPDTASYIGVTLLREKMIRPVKDTLDPNDSEAYRRYDSSKVYGRLWQLTKRGDKLRQLDMTLEIPDNLKSNHIVSVSVLKKGNQVSPVSVSTQ